MVLLVALGLLLVEPLILNPRENPFIFNILVLVFLYAYLSSAWNIMAGFTGQISFGHAAFFGLGAYTAAMLWTGFGITPWIGMIVAAAIAGFASFGVGLPSLRLKKHYFVMISLGFSEILRITFIQWYQLAGGAGGIGYPLVEYSWLALQFHTDKTPYYYLMLTMLILCLMLVYKMKTSKWGYYFMAIREDEIAAATSGINVVRYKLTSCAISAILTALGGVFYAQFILFVFPDGVMSLDVMSKIFLPAALGGLGTFMGPVIGAFILIPLGQVVNVYFTTTYGIQGLHLVVYGVSIILVSTVVPKGIVGTLFKPRTGRTEGPSAAIISSSATSVPLSQSAGTSQPGD